MVKLLILLSLLIALLSSCGVIPTERLKNFEIQKYPNVNSIINKELLEVPETVEKLVVAVYPTGFTDQTGQRRSNSTYASFSSAITQAPYNLLIRALNEAGMGKTFTVVERVSLENLTKERQIIRSTRENFDEDQQLKPLLFAGILLQGGIISYETNEKSGGLGARYFGISSSKQYREDTVTISLRLVSVSTGEILTEVLVSKSILSVSVSHDIFRFFEVGTRLFEFEGGTAQNESGVIALQKAIETGVLKLINIGIERGYWQYEETN